MTDITVRHAGDRVFVAAEPGLRTPEQARRVAQMLLATAHRAEYMRTQYQRIAPAPEAATVGEVEAS